MKLLFLTTLLSIYSLFSCAQTMRPVEELINLKEPAWPLVQEWIKFAKNKVEVLPADPAKANDALFKTQVTTRSPMGAIVFNTGGILVDEGWIRILGSGSPMLTRSIPAWNKGKAFRDFGETPEYLLIADDAVGGFFMLNGGGLGKDIGKVYYFSPDNLNYEPLDITYTEFLSFCFNNDLNNFYGNLRWTTWRQDIPKLHGDMVYHFLPYLWSKEGKDINKASRDMVPVQEQYEFNLDIRKQLQQNGAK